MVARVHASGLGVRLSRSRDSQALIGFIKRHPGATIQVAMKNMAWGWPRLQRVMANGMRGGALTRHVGRHNRAHHFHRTVTGQRRRAILLELYPDHRKTFEYVRTHEGETQSELCRELENVYGIKQSQTRWRLFRLLAWGFIHKVPKTVALPRDRKMKTGGNAIHFVTRFPGDGKRRAATFEEQRRQLAARLDAISRDWIRRRRKAPGSRQS